MGQSRDHARTHRQPLQVAWKGRFGLSVSRLEVGALSLRIRIHHWGFV